MRDYDVESDWRRQAAGIYDRGRPRASLSGAPLLPSRGTTVKDRRDDTAVFECLENLSFRRVRLLDRRVGAGQERRKHLNAECLCGPEIDDEFVHVD